MYHILNTFSAGSYHTPSLNAIAQGLPIPGSCSQGLSGLSTGDAG